MSKHDSNSAPKRTQRDSASKPGSRSAGHRGHRPAEAGAEAPKRRWSPSERADRDARSDARGGRDDRDRGQRPSSSDRSDRPARSYDRADRTERPTRSSDRNDRTDRPARSNDRNERPARSFDRNDRPARSFDRDDRPARSYDRTDRPARSYDRTDRPARSYDGDRPSRPNGDRPSRGDRSFQPRDDRQARSFDDRPKRSFDDRGDRPVRSSDRNDRPARSFDRDDRGGRPVRSAGSFNDRNDRTDRTDRGARGAGQARSGQGRPAQGRPAQGRPGQGRPGQNRDRTNAVPLVDRWDQPARPARDYREFRPERPTDRERPRRDADARPNRSYADRPARQYPSRDDAPRDDRAPRFDRSERPERVDRQVTTDRFDRERTPRVQEEDVVLARLQAEALPAEAVVGIGFQDLGIGENLARTLVGLGAIQPFPIQAATIPDVLAGRDVLGRGRTGSGKTIAFGAPMVERLLRMHREANPDGGRGRTLGRPPRALILAPTRELAQQIDRTVQDLARSVGLFTISLVGGVPYHRQITGLERGVDIVIGTPGRIEDLVERGDLDLSHVVISVLDEADHMADLGFLEPVQRILRLTADGGQKLLFSATLDTAIAKLIEEFLVEPAVHEVAGEDQESGTIEHHLLMIDPKRKREIIVELVSGASRSIVFTRTRAFAEMLAEELDAAGVSTTSLHGDLNQARRNRNLGLLTSGRVQVLVATDVAARGIHVDDVPLVIQADAPEEYKTYLHRSGRTGRAGAVGTVVTLIGRTRRRKMEELLARAEIVPEIADVAPGDALLAELAAR
jgi:superfamily II DNA/RNA helicase